MPIPNPERRRPIWPVLLRVVIGSAILLFVISRVDRSALTLVWDTRARLGFLLTVLILFISQPLSALRWRLVMGAEPGISLGYLTRIYLIGQFFSFFLPTSVGGDAVRAVAISRVSARPTWAVSSVVLERVLGLIAMFVLLGLGALIAPSVLGSALQATRLEFQPSALQLSLLLAGGALLAALVSWLVLRQPRFARLAREAISLWSSLFTRPKAALAAIAVSFLVQLSYFLAWIVLASALRLQVPTAEFLVFVPFVAIAAMLPVTIAGLGLREGAWVILLAPYGVTSANSVGYSLLYLVAFLIVGALGGMAFALLGTGLARDASLAVAPSQRSAQA